MIPRDFLEELLSDGRQWILGNDDGPKLADIHGECPQRKHHPFRTMD